MPNETTSYIDPSTTALDTPAQVVTYMLDSVHRMLNAWDTLAMFDSTDPDHDGTYDALSITSHATDVDMLECVAADLQVILNRIA